ncbi:hypothetical protein EJ02DRAFT_222503 [Clathrospora elynae]|uniref:Uncharacterized protein n=1 Tax=Clathrospora elynae TaxID=706981 RepID=A0A6A5S620_9PLEO|nr:hypothetical protein EJ02DRAFT_131568 [Clathrospora elynae]KAF1940831.1 hypothetical protein EJ02DRAFT_222503 [Clathrospora elynae]
MAFRATRYVEIAHTYECYLRHLIFKSMRSDFANASSFRQIMIQECRDFMSTTVTHEMLLSIANYQ